MTDRERIEIEWKDCCPKMARPPDLDRLCAVLDEVRAAGFGPLVKSFLDQLKSGSLSLLFEIIFLRWLIERHPPENIEYEPPPAHNPNASPPDFRLRFDGGTVDFQLKFIEQVENELAILRLRDQFRRRFGRRKTDLAVEYAVGRDFAPEDVVPALEWLKSLLREPPLDEWLDYNDPNGKLVLRMRLRSRAEGQGIILASIVTHGALPEQDLQRGPFLARQLDTTKLREKFEKVMERSKSSFHLPPGEKHFNVVVFGMESGILAFEEDLDDLFYGDDKTVHYVMPDLTVIEKEEREANGLFCRGRKERINAAVVMMPGSLWLDGTPEFRWFFNPVHVVTAGTLAGVDPRRSVSEVSPQPPG